VGKKNHFLYCSAGGETLWGTRGYVGEEGPSIDKGLEVGYGLGQIFGGIAGYRALGSFFKESGEIDSCEKTILGGEKWLQRWQKIQRQRERKSREANNREEGERSAN